jgi:hypothetical protein
MAKSRAGMAFASSICLPANRRGKVNARHRRRREKDRAHIRNTSFSERLMSAYNTSLRISYASSNRQSDGSEGKVTTNMIRKAQSMNTFWSPKHSVRALTRSDCSKMSV